MKHPIRSRWLAGLLACLAGLAAGPFDARAAHYRLFVLTGQSNSLGTTNAGEADPSPGSDPADGRVLFYWHNWVDATTSLGSSGGAFTSLQAQQGGYVYPGSATHWGPEINFGRTLYRAGVRDFGIVKCSRGGGGNTFWLKDSADDHMYDKVVDAVTAAGQVLTAGGDTFEVAGLLYLQGESDSPAEAAEAGTRFKTLVDNLRADLPNAGNLFGMIGGIAAAGATRDTVRANQQAIGASTGYIDSFSNLDLQAWTAADNLHFNKAAKLRIGERYAQAFLAAGVVARHYGKLAFIGDSITQGGNGYPSYRHAIFKHLASRGVPIDAAGGYQFVGSVTGAYQNNAGATPDVNGQVFSNTHDGHYGWRASWECARVALPAGRYNVNNLGQGTLLNWTGQATTFATADAGTLAYTGPTYTPDTASILIGINDLADGVAATQVRNDIATLIDQLRAANPNVRIFLNKTLHTNQGATRDQQVNDLHALLPALVAARNAASATSPVWLVDPDTGFAPATMTYDNIHPNATGEAYVGDRIAAALGVIESPMPAAVPPPPSTESGSGSFAWRFEGNEIWNGSAFVNGWGQYGTLTMSVVDGTDLRVVHPSTGAYSIGSTNTSHPNGWDAGNNGSWTFETRLKFNANANGFIIWLGTDTQRILVEIHGDHTQDLGNNTFNVAHNNLDGAFHVFRVTHDAANGKYHVWRDGVRLTPVAGVACDQAGTDSRLILGDYTSGTFGNSFDVTIDSVRYDATGAYLPTGADADDDGMPDSWEYQHWNAGGTSYDDLVAAITAAAAAGDDDGDGASNLDEYVANTDPKLATSVFRTESIRLVPTPDGDRVLVALADSSPQRWYALLRTTDLHEPAANWTLVAGPVAGTNGTLSLADDDPPDHAAFYRVRAALP